jgi:hypothetical protein
MIARAACLTNERRLALGLLLYSEDYETCLPPPSAAGIDGRKVFWTDAVSPYLVEKHLFQCPWNNATGALEIQSHQPYPCSYALNERFFGYFAPGPYPLSNLEIPAQTALLVEAGKLRTDGPFSAPSGLLAACSYSDVMGNGSLYPSPHGKMMSVVTVQGNAVLIKVEHYKAGMHDPEYGRIGDDIYNWNGGFPNGKTVGPPHE